jgi:hypothetical protein
VPYALTRPRLWYDLRGRGEPLLVITGSLRTSRSLASLVRARMAEPRRDG